MSWLDVVFALLLAVFIALGAERRLTGLVIGLGAVLLLRPLLLLGSVGPILSVAVGLLAGLALAVLARRLTQLQRLSGLQFAILGGCGGGLLGLTLILTLVVSLPIERNEAGQIVYPPQNLPGPLAQAVRHSRVVREGRDILLYPLLARQGDVDDARQPVIRALHTYLVVGEPWERR